MNIYLKLPKYLADWCLHEYGNSQGEICFPRGGAEIDVFEMWLEPQPDPEHPELQQPGEFPIVIPVLKSKPLPTYCYMNENAKKILTHVIMVRLRVKLWHDLYKVEKLSLPITDSIYAWMECNGIEDDPRSWEALRQMFMRQRKAYRQGKPSEKRKI